MPAVSCDKPLCGRSVGGLGLWLGVADKLQSTDNSTITRDFVPTYIAALVNNPHSTEGEDHTEQADRVADLLWGNKATFTSSYPPVY